jgi:hypothetical protein
MEYGMAKITNAVESGARKSKHSLLTGHSHYKSCFYQVNGIIRSESMCRQRPNSNYKTRQTAFVLQDGHIGQRDRKKKKSITF